MGVVEQTQPEAAVGIEEVRRLNEAYIKAARDADVGSAERAPRGHGIETRSGIYRSRKLPDHLAESGRGPHILNPSGARGAP
jgi:hypothetical protein